MQQVYDWVEPVSRRVVARRQVHRYLPIGRITLEIAFQSLTVDLYELYGAVVRGGWPA